MSVNSNSFRFINLAFVHPHTQTVLLVNKTNTDNQWTFPSGRVVFDESTRDHAEILLTTQFQSDTGKESFTLGPCFETTSGPCSFSTFFVFTNDQFLALPEHSPIKQEVALRWEKIERYEGLPTASIFSNVHHAIVNPLCHLKDNLPSLLKVMGFLPTSMIKMGYPSTGPKSRGIRIFRREHAQLFSYPIMSSADAVEPFKQQDHPQMINPEYLTGIFRSNMSTRLLDHLPHWLNEQGLSEGDPG